MDVPAIMDADCAISRYNTMRLIFLYKNVSVCWHKTLICAKIVAGARKYGQKLQYRFCP